MGLMLHLHVTCPEAPAELGPLSIGVPPEHGSGFKEASQRAKIESLAPERDTLLLLGLQEPEVRTMQKSPGPIHKSCLLAPLEGIYHVVWVSPGESLLSYSTDHPVRHKPVRDGGGNQGSLCPQIATWSSQSTFLSFYHIF